MSSADPSTATPSMDKSPGVLFANALGAAIEYERGYTIPALGAVVLRLGNSSTVRWIRQHDQAVERCSARWCPISAHVVLGGMAVVDDCWPLATAHFGAAAHLFHERHGLTFPTRVEAAVKLRAVEAEARLDALRGSLAATPETPDGCSARVLDAFDRFAALFRGEDKEWDAQDRFLARALSLFEPLQGLCPQLSDSELLEIRPLVRA